LRIEGEGEGVRMRIMRARRWWYCDQ